jgi:decaprenylphospho-beta-D-ribofuranose 2-oxidase
MKKKIGNWGNYPVVEAEERSFSFQDQLRGQLGEAGELIARGNGRCYGDAGLAPKIISTLRADKILAFDTVNGVVDCEAGVLLSDLLTVIVPKGWFLPVTPGTKFITVGGAVASDVHGKNHHVDGAFSAHVEEMELVMASGELRTCSPVQDSELFWATCGGMGLTGIITRVRFRLKPVESAYIRQKQVKAANLDEVLQLFDTYKHYTYSVAWIDCLKKGSGFGRSILILGEHASLNDLNEKQRRQPLVLAPKRQLTFPFSLPSFALNSLTVKAFNFLYYAKNTKKEINNVVSYEPFFYPLDAVLHWNRMYGKRGFVQYQFVLPLENRQGLVEILRKISEKGMGSFLAVLKIFGQQNDLISFPREGYTLALDFPVRDGLFPFLDELDKIVLANGGRIYLSKDARMKPEVFWQSYPNANQFAALIKQFNPDQKLTSLQAQRLGLFS